MFTWKSKNFFNQQLLGNEPKEEKNFFPFGNIVPRKEYWAESVTSFCKARPIWDGLTHMIFYVNLHLRGLEVVFCTRSSDYFFQIWSMTASCSESRFFYVQTELVKKLLDTTILNRSTAVNMELESDFYRWFGDWKYRETKFKNAQNCSEMTLEPFYHKHHKQKVLGSFLSSFIHLRNFLFLVIFNHRIGDCYDSLFFILELHVQNVRNDVSKIFFLILHIVNNY